MRTDQPFENKQWQAYAALYAAAYAKELLTVIAASEVRHDKKVAKAEWNLQFLNRYYKLIQLERKILDKILSRKMAVTGAGGVGKTQILLELAYRVKGKHPECIIFWIPIYQYGKH